MSDPIDRQAAIDLISQHTFYDDYDDTDKCSLLDGLRELPSAQPEKRTEERTETHACDCINRQAAIDEIDSYDVNAPDYMQGWAVKLIEAIKGDIRGLISELPSAQPELIRCNSCRHDNNCEIQYAAQAGSKFFCGAAERREE